MVELAAGLYKIHTHPAVDITLRRTSVRVWLDNDAIAGKAQIEDDVLDFLR